ncbi:hypothetical protein TIFTF001_024098 [Ficus carica]|uniref:Uncharacterized protein n=1 Tax=Ficus carica TaxID=3494 RepID=A0AA88DKB0_FICCA|nr:hypothetical protein TIFTF001_024098 [Ficus carica]
MVTAMTTVPRSEQRHELGSRWCLNLQYRLAVMTQEECLATPQSLKSQTLEIPNQLSSCCREHKISGCRRPSPVCPPCHNGPPQLNQDCADDRNFSSRRCRTGNTGRDTMTRFENDTNFTNLVGWEGVEVVEQLGMCIGFIERTAVMILRIGHVYLEAQSENIDLDNTIIVDIELDEDVTELEGSDLNKPLKKKRLKPKVWEFFNVLPLGPDKKLKSACKKCGHQYLTLAIHATGSVRVAGQVRYRFATASSETLTELGEGGHVPSETPPHLVEDGDRVSPESLTILAEDEDHDLQSFAFAITRTR